MANSFSAGRRSKIGRNQRIQKLRASNPDKWTLDALGKKFRVSRQRVHQICRHAAVATT